MLFTKLNVINSVLGISIMSKSSDKKNDNRIYKAINLSSYSIV